LIESVIVMNASEDMRFPGK